MARDGVIGPHERQTLGALRYAVNDEAESYLAIMRLFTTGMSSFLSDQSATEVAERLLDLGVELDSETVDARLSYLVEHGNLARSPRETEARSVREYLSNRARYQLTQKGELVHRHVEDLLDHTDRAREVSSEMLPGILAGIDQLLRMSRSSLDEVDQRDLAARIGTLFAQFELLVSSTRQFYTYLSQVLTRFDLGRDEFEMFKGALLDYLQRFVDEISRHMPQLSDALRRIEPEVPRLCERANSGERLVGLDGGQARRATGLDPGDWASLNAWFVGAGSRRSDADNVRRLATDAMRALLANLRRIAAGADRQQSRYADLVTLARWFDESTDDRAHELWASTFGLYSARHLSFAADTDDDPRPATDSWWHSPVAEVPVGLRVHGERRSGGRSGARVDYSAAKQTQVAARRRVQELRAAALRELGSHTGPLGELHLSDEGRRELLDLYTAALAGSGRPLTETDDVDSDVLVDGDRLILGLRSAPCEEVRITSPAGRLTLSGVRITLRWSAEDRTATRSAEA